jgi:glycosyltransferase involved in cell wall biosynthesis
LQIQALFWVTLYRGPTGPTHVPDSATGATRHAVGGCLDARPYSFEADQRGDLTAASSRYMHIALFSPAWPLEKHQNGIVTYVHWMKLELERRGHRVSVFTATVDPAEMERHVFQVRYPRLTISDRARRRAKRLLQSGQYDVFEFSKAIAATILEVHRQDPIDVIEMEESFGWFTDVAKLTSIPLVVKLHGPAFLSLVEHELNTPFGREKILREGRALKAATTVTSPCMATLAQTVERYQLTQPTQRHVENPISMDSTAPLWQMDECDRNTILFVGRFDLRKGADIILKAFLSLLEIRPNLKLLFVGPDRGLSTPEGQTLHFEAYRELLFPETLRARIEFRGPMSQFEIPRLRARSMVTVVASRWENPGYTLLEAMLQGCPVVSTDAGGCPESVIHCRTGRLSKSENPASFAEQILAMLDDPAGAAALGSAARRHVIEHHSAARIADSMLEVYKETMKPSPNVG